MSFSSFDPRLTADALGELDAADAAKLEAELGESPDGQRALAEIRQTAQLLRDALSAEPAPTLPLAARDQIIAAATESPAPATEHQPASVTSSHGVPRPAPTAPTSPAVGRARNRRSLRLKVVVTSAALLMVGAGLLLPAVYTARESRRYHFASDAPAGSVKPTSGTLGRTENAGRITDSDAPKLQNEPSLLHDQLTVLEDAQAAHPAPSYIARSAPNDLKRKQLGRGYYATTSTNGQGGGQRSPKNQPWRPRQTEQEFGISNTTPSDAAQGKAEAQIAEVKEQARMAGGQNPQYSDQYRWYSTTKPGNTETYDPIVENAFASVWQQPLSTFSIDVDTASYANVRRFLNQHTLPPPGAVRIEELVNYFPYNYAPPQQPNEPFAAHTVVADCPWAPGHRLVRIALKGKEIAIEDRPASNLVFLIDVSGSMRDANKLPLVKEGLRLLVQRLSENDRVAIVVYAGASGLALPSTLGSDKQQIMQAIDGLDAGGSTNGASGIQLAYETAVANFIRGGANRVILATDGDFNVGITDQSQLVDLIEKKAATGVFLSVLGFGMGNYKDSNLEKLSDKGNGNYAYIDSLAEARKVLVEQLSGTLVTIAKDVKIQVEFNPGRVQSYRLIGYENRVLAKEDFNNDKKDAGEIGAGHTVTALYEVVPTGAPGVQGDSVDKLEYQSNPTPNVAAAQSNDLLTLKLRYKEPDGSESKLLKFPVADQSQTIAAAGDDFEFAAAVAAFGMLLRHSAHDGTANYGMVLELAEGGLGVDKENYRHEFLELVKQAQTLAK
ncbi:MAG TPA: von Willebrand factor type A domain-containing protein [Pirellulales bacterium]|jgi:Ca-activated chloride channel family protein